MNFSIAKYSRKLLFLHQMKFTENKQNTVKQHLNKCLFVLVMLLSVFSFSQFSIQNPGAAAQTTTGQNKVVPTQNKYSLKYQTARLHMQQKWHWQAFVITAESFSIEADTRLARLHISNSGIHPLHRNAAVGLHHKTIPKSTDDIQGFIA
jgi:hypothetical protein